MHIITMLGCRRCCCAKAVYAQWYPKMWVYESQIYHYDPSDTIFLPNYTVDGMHCGYDHLPRK